MTSGSDEPAVCIEAVLVDPVRAETLDPEETAAAPLAGLLRPVKPLEALVKVTSGHPGAVGVIKIEIV